jgi:hypothetical protein
MQATIKEMDLKGKSCFEIIPAAGAGTKKKNNKEKSYIFQVENEHARERWIEALRRASAYRPPMPMELGDDAGAAQNHNNPMHENDSSRAQSTASENDEDEDGASSGVRPMSSSSFRMTNMIPTEREGYMMKKSPALMKGWQKRYFVTNKNTGDIDYYKTVRSCVRFTNVFSH